MAIENKINLVVKNTLSREIEEFVPINPPEVGMYTCGPTVYSRAHTGNLRAYISADVDKRVLKYLGFNVKHVMNITDVGHLTSDADSGEDKLQKSALKEGISAWKISKRYTDMFLKDIQRINIISPDIICRATEYISEQIELVRKLEEKGFTYTTPDGVYFDTTKLKDYGKLTKLSIRGLIAGSRIDMGHKLNPTDFALWKFSPKNQKRDMEWDSPWGTGFPGWHIECSAMSMKHLGEQFDLHTGGIDHIPIHHTNEIAQSESATGKKPFVKYWLHSEFLISEKGVKMSKSLGNVVDIDTLESLGIEPLAFRYFCISALYGKKLQISDNALKGAQSSYESLKNIIINLKNNYNNRINTEDASSEFSEIALKYIKEFKEAIANNINTPMGLAVLNNMLKDNNISNKEKYLLACDFDSVFGLGIKDMSENTSLKENIPQEIIDLANKRKFLRDSKEWGESDLIRKKIEESGYKIKDTTDNYIINKVE